MFVEGLKETADVNDIGKGAECSISQEALDNFDSLMGDENLPETSEERESVSDVRGIIPRNGGEWSGEPGNSEWKPDAKVEPGDRNGTNPNHKVWSEIMEKYEFETISFENGEPDFSEVSKGNVEIDDFSDDRSLNFDQADERMAEQKGCTPEEVAKWREENRYTWHECRDCRTMRKVPTEVHGNISHSGGISEFKAQNL